MKLPSLKATPLLLKVNCSLTSRGQYLYINFDCAIRTRKQIIGLALNNNATMTTTYPESLLALYGMKKFPKGDRIIHIYSKDLKTSKIIEIDKI